MYLRATAEVVLPTPGREMKQSDFGLLIEKKTFPKSGVCQPSRVCSLIVKRFKFKFQRGFNPVSTRHQFYDPGKVT
jgi:hypothetical protein